MGYYLCGHAGSGSHSSEDHIRGTCALLTEMPTLYSARPEEDWRYGLGQLAGLFRYPGSGALAAEPGSWLLACRPVPLPDAGRARKILWNWTPEPAALTGSILRRLRRYDKIVLPDRLSLRRLEAAGLGKKLVLGPDPAFLVEPALRPPAFPREEWVGLCLSPRSFRYERRDGLLFQCCRVLMEWILANTRLHIALIPYCVHPRQDDRLLLSALQAQFPENPRICLVSDRDSPTLRGELSRCRVVVGTAGAVAAWSCGVPALHLGITARAVGLAAALFGDWRDTLAAIGEWEDENGLLDRFCLFLTLEDTLRRRLETTAPFRRKQAQTWNWSQLN